MAPLPTKLFSTHSRTWRHNLYVYPVISRRSQGLSIGINLNPNKACNFGCVYCCVDRSTPAAVRHVDLPTVRRELDHLLRLAAGGALFDEEPFDQTPADLRRLNDVAFSGDGEPTSYRRFADACKLVADALDAQGLAGGQVKIVLITNATLLHRPAVRDALAFLDHHYGEIWAKLDAGTEAYYKTVEQTAVPFDRVLANIRDAGAVRPIVIQSMFLKLDGTGPTDAEIRAYLDRLREILSAGCRIERVQVYTLARPAITGSASPLENDAIDQITTQVQALGLRACGYYGTG